MMIVFPPKKNKEIPEWLSARLGQPPDLVPATKLPDHTMPNAIPWTDQVIPTLHPAASNLSHAADDGRPPMCRRTSSSRSWFPSTGTRSGHASRRSWAPARPASRCGGIANLPHLFPGGLPASRLSFRGVWRTVSTEVEQPHQPGSEAGPMGRGSECAEFTPRDARSAPGWV